VKEKTDGARRDSLSQEGSVDAMDRVFKPKNLRFEDQIETFHYSFQGDVLARYVQFLDADATHNVWCFPMCFLLESWIREKRLIWAKADGLKIGTIGFFLLRVIVV
jgi:hypothetical protein